MVPGVLRGEVRVPRGTGRYRSRSALTPAPPRGTTLIGQNPFEHRRYPLYHPPQDDLVQRLRGREAVSSLAPHLITLARGVTRAQSTVGKPRHGGDAGFGRAHRPAMSRRIETLLVDVVIGLAAGLVATKIYGLAQEALYRSTPRRVRRREEQVRPAPSSQVAAEKTVAGLGYSLDEHKLDLASTAIHYGLGAAWGPIYGLLRRHGGMQPLGAGVLTGATLSLIVDEGLSPALGFSAPNRSYPALTHVRGVLNHLAYGAAVAATAEALYRLTDAEPDPGHTQPVNKMR